MDWRLQAFQEIQKWSGNSRILAYFKPASSISGKKHQMDIFLKLDFKWDKNQW